MNNMHGSLRFSGMFLPKQNMLALLLLVALVPTMLAQTVLDGAGNPLYTVQDGVIYDATSKPLLTVKANLVFKGASESKNDIVLMVGTDNLFSDKSANAVSGDMQTVCFAMGLGRFYMPGYGLNDGYLIAHYSIGDKGYLVLKAGLPSVVMATLTGDKWTTGELAAVFYLVNEQYQLKEKLWASVNALGATTKPTSAATTGQATIRRMWNTGDDDFSWDGNTLKRRWNSYDYEEWEFDGQLLRRVWYEDGVEYEWDGKILKRRFNAATEEFEWDGRILRRRWNTGNDEFLVQGNVVKRVWNTGNDEWEVSGDMPIPIIAMIVFGLIRK
jgi:hypothetical protein